MFLSGDIILGEQMASVLPQSAVLQRDNSAYVFVVGADSRVAAQKVMTGRRQGTLIEISSGLKPDVRVVESGGAFLVEGDVVRVTGSVK
jgi:HlyD family secretion protein